MVEFEYGEFQKRIVKLQNQLTEARVDLLVLNQNADLYYYTGSLQPLYLMVPQQGEAFVIARKALEQIAAEIPWLRLETFTSTSDLKGILNRYQLERVQRVGFTCDKTAYATVQRWQQLFNQAEVVDLSWDMRYLRMVKSEAEIGVQAKAGVIMAEMPQLVRERFRPGMTELDLSAVIEDYLRRHGHGGLVRCHREGIEMNYGVCAAGLNMLAGTKFDGVCSGVGLSAAVPYGASDQPIAKNTPVILDFALNYRGYHLDQTRMFSWGEPDAAVYDAYQAMVRIEKALCLSLIPGKPWSAIYDQALELVIAAGYEQEFMGIGEEKVRFVGHGVGLELDEPPLLAPRMDYQLSAGMVLALEPKVTLPEIGVIGIEDTVVVTESGYRLLTTASSEFIVI